MPEQTFLDHNLEPRPSGPQYVIVSLGNRLNEYYVIGPFDHKSDAVEYLKSTAHMYSPESCVAIEPLAEP